MTDDGHSARGVAIETLAAMSDAIGEVTLLLDATPAIIGRFPAGARPLGHQMGTFEGRSGPGLTEFVHPDDVEALIMAYRTTATDGLTSRLDVRWKKADGTTWHCDVDLWPAPEAADGGVAVRIRPLRQVLGDEPLDRRVETNRELRARVAELGAFFATSSAGLLLVDLDGVVTRTNEAMAEMLGMRLDELVGAELEKLIHPDDFEAELSDAFRSGAIGTGTYPRRLVRADGGVRWTQIGVATVRDADGAPEQFALQVVDVTGVIAARRRFEAVFEGSLVPMALLDTERLITQANRALCELLGYDEAEVVGHMPRDFIHPLDLTEDFTPERIASEGGYDDLRRLRAADGSFRTVEAHAELIDVDDDPFILVTLRDETERLQAEADRTELIGALQAANEALDRFARAVAHDLRNPLSALRGFATLLGRELQPEQDAEVRERMVTASDQALEMIDGLLEAARRPTAEQEEVDLGAALQWAVEVLAVQIDAVQATIEHGPLPVIRGVEAAWRQIFLNLIGNALKYRHPDRPVDIEVRAERVGFDLEVRVADRGLGVPEERRDEVFLPGYRLADRDAAIDGSGIGLASTKASVEQHGGRVAVEDTEGGGATFVIALPLRSVVDPLD